jgi:hypothetical protein
MPIHDWSRPGEWLFRDFRAMWYCGLRDVLNIEVLPPSHYSLIEPNTVDIVTRDFKQHCPLPDGYPGLDAPPGSPVALATMPPKVRTVADLPRDYNVPADKQLAIRHVTGDRIVAIIEIVSRGNKASADEFERFVVKAAEAIRIGIHLLLIDLHPPTSRDPQGIHGAIAGQMGDRSYQRPLDKPLTLASYAAMPVGRAYVEPVAVGDALPPMPLFLDEGHYVNVPLEETYAAAYRGVPRRWKAELEGSNGVAGGNAPAP